MSSIVFQGPFLCPSKVRYYYLLPLLRNSEERSHIKMIHFKQPMDTFSGLWSCSQGKWKVDCGHRLRTRPTALLQLADNTQKRAYTVVWNPNFCDCCPGDTFRLSGSGSQQGLHLWSLRIVYMCILLKAAA